MKKTLLLVDTKIFAYRSSYQRHKPIEATLEDINTAVDYLTSNGMIDNYEVVMCFDYTKSRYRQDLLTSYKGHRPEGVAKKSEEEQAEYAKFQNDYRYVLPQLCRGLGLPVVGINGVEADDILSIIAYQFDNPMVLLTEDHDLMQIPLDLDRVTQFLPKSFRHLSKKDIQEMEGVIDKEEFLVAKAIKGDSGDSIKGIVQCGGACFNKWFAPLTGKGYSRSEWRELFIDLCNSKEKFKIHKDYDISTYEELWELNIALGETMVDLRHLNKAEQEEYYNSVAFKGTYKEDSWIELYTELCEPQVNDFGDLVTPSTFKALRNA